MAGKGRKLHTHHMHIRKAANGGYIVRHELADGDGNPPQDGQRAEMEYAIPNKAALMAHVDEHTPDGPEPPDEGPEPQDGASEPQESGE